MRDNSDADTGSDQHAAGTGSEHAEEHPAHRPFHWTRQELLALGVALVLLAVWAGATALFGFGGFILIALALVATGFVLLVTISRG